MKQLEEKIKLVQEENLNLRRQKAKLDSENKEKQKQIVLLIQQQTFLKDQFNQLKALVSSNKLSISSDVGSVELSGQLTQFQNYKLYEKDKQIDTLNNQLTQKNSEIGQLRAVLSLRELSSTQSLTQFDELLHQNQVLKNKNEILEKENDQLLCEKKAEGLFRIELDHLRAENQLYSELLGFKPSIENQGQLEFHPESVLLKSLKNVKYPIKPSNQTFDYCRNCQKEIYLYRPCCNPLYNLSDNLLYVPGDAFSFTQQFKNKYIHQKNDLDVDQILDILLFELNKIWHTREKNHLKLLASLCQKRIQDVKRQQNQQPLGEKEMIQNLRRLKTQIKELQKENLEIFQKRFESPLIQL